MFLVLFLFILCLAALDCPWWLPRPGVLTCGGGGGGGWRHSRAPGAAGMAIGGSPPPGRAEVWGAARGRPLPVSKATDAGYAPSPGTRDPTPYPAALDARYGGGTDQGTLPACGTHLTRLTGAYELTARWGGGTTRQITCRPPGHAWRWWR